MAPSVNIGPGLTTLDLMPFGASSSASTLEKLMMAPLQALRAARFGR